MLPNIKLDSGDNCELTEIDVESSINHDFDFFLP